MEDVAEACGSIINYRLLLTTLDLYNVLINFCFLRTQICYQFSQSMSLVTSI